MIVIWIAAIVVFGIVEAVTVGLVSIWFVLGAVAGLLAAVLGAALWVQIVLFFVVSIAALAATRPLVQKMLHRDETPTNADRVLGQTARVTETIDNTVPTGAVYADGKTWTARSASGRVIPKDTLVKVQRMEACGSSWRKKRVSPSIHKTNRRKNKCLPTICLSPVS